MDQNQDPLLANFFSYWQLRKANPSYLDQASGSDSSCVAGQVLKLLSDLHFIVENSTCKTTVEMTRG